MRQSLSFGQVVQPSGDAHAECTVRTSRRLMRKVAHEGDVTKVKSAVMLTEAVIVVVVAESPQTFRLQTLADRTDPNCFQLCLVDGPVSPITLVDSHDLQLTRTLKHNTNTFRTTSRV